MNFELARYNMIEQQIRPWEVLNQAVLDLISEVHREDFMPESYRELALADIQIPLPHGQVTMTPKVEARLLQALDIQPGDHILEIGTGCAYMTALLAKSGKQVTSVDIFRDFSGQAVGKLKRYGISNVRLDTGDAIRGWDRPSRFDAIAVTGSIPVFDACFQEQLAIGGRLFLVVGRPPVMEAILITRMGNNEWSRESLFETDLPPLIGAKEPDQFKL